MANQNIPTVTLCDLARNPADYFEKQVRLTAVFEQWTEGQYLTDERCPFGHDDQIGAGWAEGVNTHLVAQMNSPEYEGKALVSIVGTLRNTSARHFYWYGTRFDIAAVESIRPLVTPYTGDLQEGWTFRAQGTYTRGELTVEPRLNVPFHHAGRIEWANLGEMKKAKPVVVFRVISKEVTAAGPGRWNTIYHCEVVRVE